MVVTVTSGPARTVLPAGGPARLRRHEPACRYNRRDPEDKLANELARVQPEAAVVARRLGGGDLRLGHGAASSPGFSHQLSTAFSQAELALTGTIILKVGLRLRLRAPGLSPGNLCGRHSRRCPGRRR